MGAWVFACPGLTPGIVSFCFKVNEAIETPLIYDFYGFPNHFYTQMFPHRSAPWLVSLVKDSLTEGGVRFSGVTGKGRGLDQFVLLRSSFEYASF